MTCHPSVQPVGFLDGPYTNNALQYANGARLTDIAGVRITKQFKDYGAAFLISSEDPETPADEEPDWEDVGEPVDMFFINPSQWGQGQEINLEVVPGDWSGVVYIPEVPDPDSDDVFYPLLSYGHIIAVRLKIEPLPRQPAPIYLTDGDGVTTLLAGQAELEYVRLVEDIQPGSDIFEPPESQWEPTVDISDEEYNPTLVKTLRVAYPPPA